MSLSSPSFQHASQSTNLENSQHESEKPHPCTRCKKRFKSPTEAERHMNAIHLKADFWSCKALEDPLRAYHTQSCDGVMLDVCGFCGGEFVRRDGVADSAELVAHVKSVHRVADCDRNKKFYRADNFRQHLKNTHVALQGRWLKALERACRSSKAEEDGKVGTASVGVLVQRGTAGGDPGPAGPSSAPVQPVVVGQGWV
jgi:hypothetical protein